MNSDIKKRPHALYRIFRANGDLLYIGISKHIFSRLQEHSISQHWTNEIDFQKTKIQWFSSRQEAEQAEKKAIQMEKPLYNVTHNDLKRNAKQSQVVELYSKEEEKVNKKDNDNKITIKYFSNEQIEKLWNNGHICCKVLLDLKIGNKNYEKISNFLGNNYSYFIDGKQFVDLIKTMNIKFEIWPDYAEIGSPTKTNEQVISVKFLASDIHWSKQNKKQLEIRKQNEIGHKLMLKSMEDEKEDFRKSVMTALKLSP